MKLARRGPRLVERAEQVEAALWRRLHLEGDSSCRAQLFDLHATLARGVARREFRRRPPHGLERSDFEQLAFRGLLEAIDHFDPLHGAPFDAFARHRIRGAIADGSARSSEQAAQVNARRRIEQDRLKSLREGRAVGGNAIAELADLASALAIGFIAESANSCENTPIRPYESIDWRDLQMRVVAEIDRLPTPEQTVMRQHYLNNVPFKEIATLLRLSKGRIAQIHRAAIARLRLRIRDTV